MHPGDQARTLAILNSWLAQYPGSGAANNPAATTVIADTGALSAGWYDVYFSVSCSAALAYDDLSLQWRNDANDTTLWEEWFQSAGAGSQRGKIESVYIGLNERIRIITVNGITGDVSGSLIAVFRCDVKVLIY